MWKKVCPILLVFVYMLGLEAPALHSQTVLTGTTEGGAYYKVVVPVQWNGDLVVWNHGLSLDLPAPDPDLGPLAALQLAEGYAVAASSYRQAGWALFKTKNDLQNLVNVFKESVATPNAVIITGASLGGLVTAQSLEEAHVGNVAGALSMCGAVAGSRNWDEALDLRLIYDVVCGPVPGAALPGGPEGLPPNAPFTPTDLALAVNACTGILIPPPARTPEQDANLTRLLSLAKIPENFLLTDMLFATLGLSDLVHDPTKLAGHIGTGNQNVDYGDPEINAFVQRAVPNPGAANRLSRNFTPRGDVGNSKIVSMHTDKDGLVFVENESAYAHVVPATNLTTAIVVEAVPTHCEFTGAEVVAGWEALRAWIDGGPQPSAAAIQGMCLALEPVYGGPCRIDPAFVIPDIDDRIRPRE